MVRDVPEHGVVAVGVATVRPGAVDEFCVFRPERLDLTTGSTDRRKSAGLAPSRHIALALI